MTDKTMLLLGAGFTARAFARAIAPDGWRTSGTTRSADRAGDLAEQGIEPVLWPSPDQTEAAHTAIKNADALLISAAPNEAGCPVFHLAHDIIANRAQEISWIGYLSTNGVYGDHQGAWVDENSMLYPTTTRARNRIAAEAAWAELGVAHNIPVVIFRLPGIYGPGRSTFDAINAGRAKRIYKEGQAFSRAHVDDIAAALKASLANPQAGDLFNIADDEPAPPQDVVEFACKLSGAPVPPLTPIEQADMSEMAKSFYQDSKKVSNAAMKNKLGVTLKYPTYREGLTAIFENAAAQS